MDNLHELFVDELRDVYSAEKQLTRALPKMAKAATSPELKAAFTDHLAATRDHVARLEAVFRDLGAKPGGKKCAAMEGLVEESAELIGEGPVPEVLDAGLVAAAQRVEHYEMAAYGSLVAFAKALGHKSAVPALEATLKEEKAADDLLSKLAESGINRAAVAPASSAAPKPKAKSAKPKAKSAK